MRLIHEFLRYLGSWICSKERDINVCKEEQAYKKRASGSLEKVTCTIQNRRIALDMFFVMRALQRNSSVITRVPPVGRGLVERGCPLTT